VRFGPVELDRHGWRKHGLKNRNPVKTSPLPHHSRRDYAFSSHTLNCRALVSVGLQSTSARAESAEVRFDYESQEASTPLNPECVESLGAPFFRVGPANSLVDTFTVNSRDGGNSFGVPVKVTTVTSNWCTTVTNIFPNFGDYIGGTSGANRVLPIWADGRNGIPDTFFAPFLGPGK